MPELSFDVIGFAGGGNRCYWQSGFIEALQAVHPQQPDYYVAVSAGAYHCVMSVIGIGERVRTAAFGFAGERRPDIDWGQLRNGRSPLVVGDLFRQFLASEFGALELAALKAAPPILIQVSHLPAWLPGPLAAISSIAAYQIEKAVTGGRHSKAGRYLGLQSDWISTHDMETPEELVAAIMASSSVPPFMPVGRVRNRAALDGGLTDNPPIAKLQSAEEQSKRTLLLTTRHGRMPPAAVGRTVVGPSEEIAVNKFAVGDEQGIRRAFELGQRDGARFATRLPAILAGRRNRDV